eukprot:2438784-Prymnesium_polylepis.2
MACELPPMTKLLCRSRTPETFTAVAQPTAAGAFAFARWLASKLARQWPKTSASTPALCAHSVKSPPSGDELQLSAASGDRVGYTADNAQVTTVSDVESGNGLGCIRWRAAEELPQLRLDAVKLCACTRVCTISDRHICLRWHNRSRDSSVRRAKVLALFAAAMVLSRATVSPFTAAGRSRAWITPRGRQAIHACDACSTPSSISATGICPLRPIVDAVWAVAMIPSSSTIACASVWCMTQHACGSFCIGALLHTLGRRAVTHRTVSSTGRFPQGCIQPASCPARPPWLVHRLWARRGVEVRSRGRCGDAIGANRAATAAPIGCPRISAVIDRPRSRAESITAPAEPTCATARRITEGITLSGTRGAI